MGDAATAKKRSSKNINKRKMPKRQCGKCKPDVMLITEDVTLPIMKPIKLRKSYPMHGSEKGSIKIVRQSETKHMARQSFLEPPSNLYEKKPAEQYEVYKAKQILEEPVKMPPRNSSILDAYFQTKLKASLIKRDKPSLPFPNMMMKPQAMSISNKDCTKSAIPKTLPAPNKPVTQSQSMNPNTRIVLQIAPNPRKKQLKHTTKRKPPPKDNSNISNETFLTKKYSEPLTPQKNPSLQAVLNFKMTSESSSSGLSTMAKSSQGLCSVREGSNSRTNKISRNISPAARSERELKIYDYKNDAFSLTDSRRNIANCMRTIAETDSRSKSNTTLPLKDVKYSWQNISSWVPPCRRKKESGTMCEEEKDISKPNDLHCKIKYSWQVIGTGSQTSRTLLQDLLDGGDGSGRYQCDIKYSWQIIGTATQASMEKNEDANYWHGLLLAPRATYKNSLQCKNAEEIGNRKYGRRLIVLNNKDTQTFANKQNQTDFTDCRAKYSWENVLKQYL